MTTSSDSRIDFLIKRDDLNAVEFARSPAPVASDLSENQIAVKIDAFAFTSNNITYALLGDELKYWSFFPGPEGFGRLPVWGFADVLHSAHAEIEPGERLFGYFPISTHLVMQPDKIGERGFLDVTPHRVKLPALYNQYSRVAADPGYDADFEAEHMLLSPLFGTSFLLGAFLISNDFFDAKTVVFSSASAKTAFATARQLKGDDPKGGRSLVGLTSARNVDFVKGLNCYDRVLSYEELTALDPDSPAVFLDFAGNSKFLRTLHEHFGDQLTYSCRIGSTNPGKQEAAPDSLPGPKPAVFFAPLQMRKTMKELGPRVFQERFDLAWKDFRAAAGRWITPVREAGEAAVERVYQDMMAGRAAPDKGYVLSL